jgi:hypothetical protein
MGGGVGDTEVMLGGLRMEQCEEWLREWMSRVGERMEGTGDEGEDSEEWQA